MDDEKAGHCVGAGSRHGRRLRARHAVRSDDRRRGCKFWRAGGAVLQRWPGNRHADDHRLQEGARAALFRRYDRCQDARSNSAWSIGSCRSPNCLKRASLGQAALADLAGSPLGRQAARSTAAPTLPASAPHLRRARRRRPALRDQDRIRPEVPRDGRAEGVPAAVRWRGAQFKE